MSLVVLLTIAMRLATLASFLTVLMETRNVASWGRAGTHTAEGHGAPLN